MCFLDCSIYENGLEVIIGQNCWLGRWQVRHLKTIVYVTWLTQQTFVVFVCNCFEICCWNNWTVMVLHKVWCVYLLLFKQRLSPCRHCHRYSKTSTIWSVALICKMDYRLNTKLTSSWYPLEVILASSMAVLFTYPLKMILAGSMVVLLTYPLNVILAGSMVVLFTYPLNMILAGMTAVLLT